MTWDASDPWFMGCVVAAILAGIAFATAMDMRRLPLGRIKWVPWTGMTVALFFALILAAHVLLRDVAAS